MSKTSKSVFRLLPATLSSVSLLPSSEYLAKSKESRVLMLPARSVINQKQKKKKKKEEELNSFLFNCQNKHLDIN